MDQDDRRLLSDYGEFFPVQEGQHVIVEGEEQNALYYVISGLLEITIRREGADHKLGRVGAGESLGEVNLFDPDLASASVVAGEFTQVWRCTRQDLESFLSSYHEAGSRLLIGIVTNMSQRLRQMNERCIENDLLGAAAKMWS